MQLSCKSANTLSHSIAVLLPHQGMEENKITRWFNLTSNTHARTHIHIHIISSYSTHTQTYFLRYSYIDGMMQLVLVHTTVILKEPSQRSGLLTPLLCGPVLKYWSSNEAGQYFFQIDLNFQVAVALIWYQKILQEVKTPDLILVLITLPMECQVI